MNYKFYVQYEMDKTLKLVLELNFLFKFMNFGKNYVMVEILFSKN